MCMLSLLPETRATSKWAMLTLYALRVISIKFLLVISILCKTEWSWELRIWSHKMNLHDILSTSPHYFCGKWIGATNENSNFNVRVVNEEVANLALLGTGYWVPYYTKLMLHEIKVLEINANLMENEFRVKKIIAKEKVEFHNKGN